MSQGGRHDTPLADVRRIYRIGLELVGEDPLCPQLEYIVRPRLAGGSLEGLTQSVCQVGKGV